MACRFKPKTCLPAAYDSGKNLRVSGFTLAPEWGDL